MIDVIFDISHVGFTELYKGAQTGIFNYTYNVAKELALNPECRLFLSACNPWLTFSAIEFFKEHPLEGVVSYPPFTVGQEIGTALELALSKMMDINGLEKYHWLFNKLQEQLEKKALRLGHSLRGIDPLLLEKPGLFHSPSPSVPLPSIIKKQSRVLTIHDFFPVDYPDFFSSTLKYNYKRMIKSLRKGDTIVCHSNHVREEVIKRLGFPSSSVFTVYPGLSDDLQECQDPEKVAALKEKLGIGSSPYFLTVGRLDPRKNYIKLVHAFHTLLKSHPHLNVKLVMVGAKHLDAEDIDQLTNENIITTGFIPNEELSILYSGALGLVHPALAEGFGLPIIEAMRCKAPVICSNTTSMPEAAGGAALLVDPLSEEEISTALYRLATNQALREELKEKGAKRASSFTWKKTAEELLSVYKLVL